MGGLTLSHPTAVPAGRRRRPWWARLRRRSGLTAILTPNALLQHLAQSSAHASRAAQHLVVFDAPDVTAQSASIIADAATIAAEAIGGMTRRADGRRYLARLSKVLLVPGLQACRCR